MIRELAGDLVVHMEELSYRTVPRFAPGLPLSTPEERRYAAGTVSAQFRRFTNMHERLFELAMATARAAQLEPIPDELRSALAEHAGFVSMLWGYLDDGLDHIGYEYGGLYGGQPWDELCRVRSALELLRVLTGGPVEDSAATERVMAKYGLDMFVAQAIPDGIPASHWWWFRDSP